MARSVVSTHPTYLAARRLAARLASAAGLRHPWVKQRPNSEPPQPLENFELYAVLGAWMEADVIGATVRNAFTQGCERVFLVDNDSSDDTIANAVAAGAELADRYAVERHDEHERIRRMNDVVARVSTETSLCHIWWLWLDADEFPHGPRGLTVREYLSTLDARFRIVGGRFFNHYPSCEPYYVPGRHPLDFQPLCEELRSRMCWANHRKHSLQRFDRRREPIRSDIGFHRAISDDHPLWEPEEAIFIHHFPFRERQLTEGRLRALVDSGRVHGVEPAGVHMRTRRRVLEAVYSNNWKDVGTYVSPDAVRPQLEPRPWEELVAAEDAAVKRWYSQ